MGAGQRGRGGRWLRKPGSPAASASLLLICLSVCTRTSIRGEPSVPHGLSSLLPIPSQPLSSLWIVSQA